MADEPSGPSAERPSRPLGLARSDLASVILLPSMIALLAALLFAVLGIGARDLVAFLGDGIGSYVVTTVTAGAIVLGVMGGVLGSFAVMRGQSLLGDAVSHSALPGIYLVFMAWSAMGAEGVRLLGQSLPGARSLPVVLLGALATGLLATALITVVVRETRLKADAALGLTLASFFGAGIVLRSLLQTRANAFGNRAGLESFLYGTAATMTRDDVRVMAVLAAIGLLIVALVWKEFKLLSFDPDFLATLGFPVRALDALLTSLIVVSVIIGLQMVGVILMSAMLIAPAVAARQWTDRFAGMLGLAALFGVVSGVVGVIASSMRASLATGPLIAVFASGLALASVIVAPNRGVLWQSIRAARQRRSFALDTLLIHLHDLRGGADVAATVHALRWPARRLAAIAAKAERAGLLNAAGGRLALTAEGEGRVSSVLEGLAIGSEGRE